MTNKITLKRSSQAAKVPEPGDLDYGELALNFTDGNLFFKSNANVITTLASTQFVSVTGNITGGNLVTAGTANVATLTASTLVNATATTAATSTTTGAIKTAGGVGVTGNVHVGGALVATTKSFAIQHPDKAQVILYHGCLEGPEHAVYVRGRCATDTIKLPDYWANLVDPESITVHLTAVGACENAKIVKITQDAVTIQGSPAIDCFYIIHATRCDVPALEIEVPGNIQDLYTNRNH